MCGMWCALKELSFFWSFIIDGFIVGFYVLDDWEYGVLELFKVMVPEALV